MKNTCEGYKGSGLIEPKQAIEKADYKCGKSFYLDTYKKKIKKVKNYRRSKFSNLSNWKEEA